MITLSAIELIVFGAICSILGAVIALNWPLLVRRKKEDVAMERMRKWVKTHYRF